ncbi:MAG TPA: DUF4265 domain-containing protein [Bryobacteraceae bacterium]|nr:DUF4265 domain-containing protein [Acidobacteriaceae bacterium]
MADENFKKVVFRLEQDEHGYPPDNWESLWAKEIELGLYSIDNIPIFVKGISSEDVVEAEENEGELRYKRLVRPSANSVFRLYLSDIADVPAVRESFRKLGCESEQSHIPKLVAVEIPGNVAIEPVAALLDEGAVSGRWEYEEGVLRHLIAS